jgi:hypothetical protein
MIDLVRSKCYKCGVSFDTWLGRGETAPALCLGCWWRETPRMEVSPGNRPEQDPATDKSPVDLAKATKEARNVPKGS